MLQVLYETDGRPQAFNLTSDQATIGRATDNDIVLNDFSVSRRHAYLRRENGVWPEPLSWMSRRAPRVSMTSPSRIARPSPSCGTK